MTRFILIAAAAAGVFGSPAIAEPTQPSRQVIIGDLDLSSVIGQADLDRRIKRAVIQVCDVKILGDKVRNADIDQCRLDALAQARREAATMIATREQRTRLAVYGR